MNHSRSYRWLLAMVLLLSAAGSIQASGSETVLNDVHSRLNATSHDEVHQPTSRSQVISLVKRAKRLGKSISISGGKHSMGGQQFGKGTLHLNMSRYGKVLRLDREKGLVTVESGVQWPELMDWLLKEQPRPEKAWGIRQKQTGADRLSIGGALSSNIHGRGLKMKPMIGDVEAFELIDAEGAPHRCSREENPELFGLVIGGYGLFGVITEVTLRLAPRTKVERKVEVVALRDVPRLVRERIQEGFLYGDYQFKTNEQAKDFLEKGVFSFYRPVPFDRPVKEGQKELSGKRWVELYKLAHLDKERAFQTYADYYLTTDGQVYWNDTHQMSYYVTGFDEVIDRISGSRAPGSLMICEFYVPRSDLPSFLRRTAKVIRKEKADLVYGTVRYIERDDESFLAWAKQPWACSVMNLRVTHDEAGLEEAKRQFRAITDAALGFGGSYFLTYHRWARKDQVLKAYPQFIDFLRFKRKYDPQERFQSDWYRHYKEMFAVELAR